MTVWEIKKLLRSRFFQITYGLILFLFLYTAFGQLPEDWQERKTESRYSDEIITYAQSGYREDMIRIVEQAVSAQRKTSEPYGYSYYEKAIRIYNTGVEITPVSQRLSGWINRFHSMGGTDYLYWLAKLFWVILLSMYVFGMDGSVQLCVLIRTTAGGREQNYIAKVLALCAVLFSVCLIQCAVEVLQACVIYGADWRELTASIQSLRVYERCNFHVSILGAVLMMEGAVLVLELSIMLLISLASCFLKPLLSAVTLSAVCIGSTIWLSRLMLGNYLKVRWFAGLRQFCPTALLFPRYYFTQYDYGRLFGQPVNNFGCCAAVWSA